MSLIPGWDSIASTHWWGNAYFWASIAALILLGVFEVVSHRYGERYDDLVAIEQAEIKKRNDKEIADLHDAASKANVEAGKANERAAILEKDAATSRERSAALEIQAANAQKEATLARTEQERLKAKVIWRTLSQPQCDALTVAIQSDKGTIFIEYAFGDPEALNFAISLQNCFGNAGWQLHTTAAAFKDVLPKNLLIAGATSPRLDAVKRGFESAVVPYSSADAAALEIVDRNTIQRFGNWGPADVRIVVGSRPVS